MGYIPLMMYYFMIPGEWEGQRNYTMEIVQNEDNPSQIIIYWEHTDNPQRLYTSLRSSNVISRNY